jgi:predicted nucleotidyltransferase
MSIEAIYPNGRVEMLSHVENFNFNWHVNYVYADDVSPLLPAGTMIKLTAWHDNTSANRANPDPTQWVGWGQRSYDDMYHAHVRYIELAEEDYEELVRERRRAAAGDSD